MRQVSSGGDALRVPGGGGVRHLLLSSSSRASTPDVSLGLERVQGAGAPHRRAKHVHHAEGHEGRGRRVPDPGQGAGHVRRHIRAREAPSGRRGGVPKVHHGPAAELPVPCALQPHRRPDVPHNVQGRGAGPHTQVRRRLRRVHEDDGGVHPEDETKPSHF